MSSRKTAKRKGRGERPDVPLFREATPAGWILVERHLRRKTSKAKKAPKGRRR